MRVRKSERKTSMIKVTVYNEAVHEKLDEAVREIYPQGIHGAIKEFLDADGDFQIRTVTLDDVQSITKELLDDTDVLLWWGHLAHHMVPDEVAQLVQEAVLGGMGFIALHSGHHSKPFRKLMGTTCNLSWREDGDMERLWVIKPGHPIAQGIDRYFEIPHDETYAEPFDIPEPDELVFGTWYEGGEIFRSGCCWNRGHGKVFYFQPGHETFPVFKDKNVQTVIKNAIHWAKPVVRLPLECPNVKKIGT